MPSVTVFYSTSRLLREIFKPIFESECTDTNSLRLVQDLSEALHTACSNHTAIVVLDGDSMVGDWQNLGRTLDAHPSGTLPIMVLLRDRRSAILRYLQKLGLRGAFDTFQEGHKELLGALKCIGSGGSYWSPSLVHHILRETTIDRKEKTQLTPFEDEVMSVIGGGLDDIAASAILGVSASTIASTRKAIHRKVGVQQRSELISFAIRKGYCDAGGAGIIRARHNFRTKESVFPTLIGN